MKIVSIRDFRNRPRTVQDELKHEREAVLTANGRPVALMIAVDAGTIDGTLEMLRRARALEAVRALREHSRRRGVDRLTVGAIDAVIAKTRKARARRRAG